MNPEIVTNVILDGCDQSERIIRSALRNAPYVVRAVIDHHPLTFALPDAIKAQIVSWVVEAAKEAAETLLEAIDLFRKLARSAGRPTELRMAAATVQSDVASAADRLSADSVTASLRGLDQENWKADSTTSYATGLAEQAMSVQRIGEAARALDRTLRDMADSIESFYGELLWAWIGAGVAVAGLVTAIATAGPTLGIGAIVGIIISIIGVITSLISIIMAFTASADRNRGNANALSASPGLVWTRSAFAS